MTDETTQAEAPAEEISTIIDLDAPTEPVVEEEEKAAEPEKEESKEGDEKPKKLSGSQRAKIREARLLSELSARDREIESLRQSVPAAKAGESDEKPPREEDYNGDYFAWQRALTAHEAGLAASKAVEKQFKTLEDSKRSTQQAEIAREREIAHQERVEDARDVIADFDTAMKAMDGVQVRQEVIDEIMSSENSAVIAYHLAKNPNKLNALNSMSGRELAREMGRLEASVKLPEAKKATTAPVPLSTVKGGAAPSSAESDLAKWMAKTYGKRA